MNRIFHSFLDNECFWLNFKVKVDYLGGDSKNLMFKNANATIWSTLSISNTFDTLHRVFQNYMLTLCLLLYIYAPKMYSLIGFQISGRLGKRQAAFLYKNVNVLSMQLSVYFIFYLLCVWKARHTMFNHIMEVQS